MDQSAAAQISGSVERITYYNETNGYTVLRLKPDSRDMLPYRYASGRDGLITVVGNLPELNVGEWLKMTGRWGTHPKHGRQFLPDSCEQSLPATVEGIKRYLGSGMIRGVGKVMAERIVMQFGEETLDVIEFEPERLTIVPGIGRKRLQGIEKAWDEQRTIKDVMLFLQSHGVTTGLATKIFKRYGEESLTIVRNTPYRMVQDIRGVGFKTADKIAQALGLAKDDPGRIEAGVAYTLNRMAEEGHVYVPQGVLEPNAAEILELDTEQVAAVIDALENEALLKREEIPNGEDASTVAVYLTTLYFAEVGVANRLRKIASHPISLLASSEPLPVGQQRELWGVELTESQQEAVAAAVRNKVTVLTGGPGTGKTTTLRSLLDLLDRRGWRYELASPTGRAAKRLAEATGRPAKTIHRLLAFKPGEGFGKNEQDPLDVDMVIIDEASMMDLVLANNLLKAIKPGSHVLFVGDVDQLPSVGAGDVLRDLIASGVIAVVRLETVFRQASNSLIITNAHRINEGKFPETHRDAQDFFLFVKDAPVEASELLVDIVTNRVPSKFGLDPFDDIQVLSPMYSGAVGVSNLNEILQKALNGPSKRRAERRLGGRTFRVGDKVMQIVNNYDKNVYNGDIGRVTAIDVVEQTLSVNIDGAPVVYDFLETDELVHAYAISVHKSQGAEYPCVVIPMSTSHYLMLQRNLLYTAITRAKKVAILVGTRRAVALAVKNNQVAARYTALNWRLAKNHDHT